MFSVEGKIIGAVGLDLSNSLMVSNEDWNNMF